MSALRKSSIPPRAPINATTILLHAWSLAPMIAVHVGAVGVFFVSGGWADWITLAVVAYVRGLISTIGYHRFFSHRSFKTSRVGQFLLGCACCSNLQQGPMWWAAYHRHHHRHSDDTGDVHSPHHGGFWWAYCGWLFIPLQPQWEQVRDLRRYPELVFLERWWQIPGILLAVGFWWIGGWSLLCIGFCLSAVLSFQLTFTVNTLGHLVGSRRYATADHSTNSFLLAVLSLGDGWHNNHHHYPHTAQAGFFWWEIDGAFRLIRLMERCGLIWDVRRVPDYKLHADLEGTPKEPPIEESPVLCDLDRTMTESR